MATTADFRNGLVLELEGQLYTLVTFQHVKPGKGGAFVRTRLKHVSTGRVSEKTFNAGVKITTARVERRPFQFVYRERDCYYFMDQTTYETLPIPRERIEGRAWLGEGATVEVLVHQEREEIIRCLLPPTLTLRVTKATQAVEGNTANKAQKYVTLESGKELSVPLFIQQGDLIKVDRIAGKYLDRLEKAS